MANEWRHPELQEGEVLLGNYTWERFERLGWRTKRDGRQAYDKTTHELLAQDSMKLVFPVFIMRSEFD